MVRLRTLKTAAALVVVMAATVGARAEEFSDAFRTRSISYLITPTGEVHAIRPGGKPEKLFVFHDIHNRRYHFFSAPSSFIQWSGEWFVADGSGRLYRFDHGGRYVASIDMPPRVRVPKLAATDKAVWATNMMSSNTAEQLWRSTDGRNFSSVLIGTSMTLASPADNLLVLRGSSSGEVYVASMVGAPVVHRIWPKAGRADIAIASSRSRARADQEQVTGAPADLTSYSLPIRDMLPLPDGGVAVLRNREDVRGTTRVLELLKGRRADRYDRNGRQLATAVFAQSVHWLLQSDHKRVSGISDRGEVALAEWARPIPGEIIDP